MAKSRPKQLPSKDDLFAYIESIDGQVTKRDLARAFNIKGGDRVYLKQMIRELIDEGRLEKDFAKTMKPAGSLPSVGVIEVREIDAQGELICAPTSWTGEDKPPIIRLAPDRHKKGSALGVGQRALARLSAVAGGRAYEARIIKVLDDAARRRLLGVYHGGPLGGRVVPVDKKSRNELFIDEKDTGDAVDGELVMAELLSRSGRGSRPLGLKPARVVQRLGDVSGARSVSLIAIHAHGIPTDFPDAAIKEAEGAKPVPLGQREDLRDVPLITIDPSDARDHDDAIFAQADDDPNNPGGWHLIIAIADVAHYVRPGSQLDKEARKRGNSCYFPDRVVPMLPEALSADLCSLKPGVDRAAMALHIWIDKDGNKRRHRFTRALIRSAANIAYEAVQKAMDGLEVSEVAEPLMEPVLKPLYGAYNALANARDARQPLDLDIPERKIVLSPSGEVEAVRLRERLDAHRVVEDFMIIANVCAAETLEARQVPCMYRIHEEPAMDKMEALREFLQSLDYRMAKGQVLKPSGFNRILHHFDGTQHSRLVNDVVLRSQTQAYYGPDNMGHFGLALARYAHFTSPIRRYSDLLVHRGLIRALGLGKDGLTEDEITHFGETGEHISTTERRAMMAERDSVDRYMAAFLSAHVGDVMPARISGVTRFGLFATLEPSGGDGLIPLGSLYGDYYHYDESRHALIGQRRGHIYQLGDQIEVRIIEADKITGGLRLELIGEGVADDKTRLSRGRRHHGPIKAKQKSRGRSTAKRGKRR